MNPVTNSIFKIVMSINRLIDMMDKRTIESIKQGTKMFAFFLAIGCIILGVHMGRKAAKTGGIQMVNKTNDIFQIDVKRRAERPWSASMVDSDRIQESRSPGLSRYLFPSRDEAVPQDRDGIVEPAQPSPSRAGTPGVESRDTLAEIDRTGDSPVTSDVRTLKRADSNTESGGTATVPETQPVTKDIRTQIQKNSETRETPKHTRPAIIRSPGTVAPMEKDRGVVE